MEYYDSEDRRGRRTAIVAVAGYLMLCLGLALWVRFDLGAIEPGGGILIDFGDSAAGSGRLDPAPVPRRQTAETERPVPSDVPEELLTGEDEEAPAIARDESKKIRKEESRQSTESDKRETEAEPVRQVNRKALFPGMTAGSQAASQGTSQGAGNEGDRDGKPGGDPAGTGAGSSGVSFELAGRNVVGEFPKPGYTADDEGRVVVRITVDASGAVTGASFQAAGSTTQNGQLVAEALEAARRARFTPAEGKDLQTGTITYIFRLE